MQNYKIDSYIQIVLNKFNFNCNSYHIHVLSTDLNFNDSQTVLKPKITCYCYIENKQNGVMAMGIF